MLKEDEPHFQQNPSSFKQYLKEKKQSWREAFKSKHFVVGQTQFTTIKDILKNICSKMGRKVPSQALKLKLNLIDFFFKGYEAKIAFQTSNTFLSGSLQDWNCNTLV